MSVSEERTRKGDGVIHSEARELTSKVIQLARKRRGKKNRHFLLRVSQLKEQLLCDVDRICPYRIILPFGNT
jgi:hypothetical protein